MSRSGYKFCPICSQTLIAEERGGRERLICAAPGCGFVHWENPISVVAAIVEHEQQVVLVQSHGWPDSWYGLVAGFLETGERPVEAVRREVVEELGLEPRIESFIGSYPMEPMNQIIFVYHVRIDSLDIRLCAAELKDYKAVPITDLKPWSRGTGPALRDWLASRGLHPPVVEFGEHL